MMSFSLCAALFLTDSHCFASVSSDGRHDRRAPETSPALPDAADVVSAYLTMRRWIDALELPSQDDPASKLNVAGAHGVCVQLRRSGAVLGSSSISPMPQLDRSRMLRRAVGRAMSQVLAHGAIAGLPDELRGEVGRSLVLEIEIAGRPEPLLVRNLQQFARQIEPGLHGVAVRRGDRWAMLFPSQLQATNSASRIAARVRSLIEDFGVDAGDLGTLAREHGVSIYRFRTSHLVQNAPDELPFETHRGDRLIPVHEVNPETIADTVDRLVSHLLTRAWPEHIHDEVLALHSIEMESPPVMLGDYRPTADRYDPLVARPLDQALAAYGMARYASMHGAEPQIAKRAAHLANDALFALQKRFQSGRPEIRVMAVEAASLLAIDTLRGLERDDDDFHLDGSLRDWAEELVERLSGNLAMISQGGRGQPEVSDVDPHAVAMACSALARRMSDAPDDSVASLVRQTLDLLWQDVPFGQAVALLPWIGWAERDLATAMDWPMGGVDRLSQLRDALNDVQVGFSDHTSASELPADLHGGFLLIDRHRPDSQSSRPTIWLASAMQLDEFADAEALEQDQQRLHAMMRFHMQLSVRESAEWWLRNPERTLGGIRNASWDSDQPLAAQAMGLLALIEGFRAINKQQDRE